MDLLKNSVGRRDACAEQLANVKVTFLQSDAKRVLYTRIYNMSPVNRPFGGNSGRSLHEIRVILKLKSPEDVASLSRDNIVKTLEFCHNMGLATHPEVASLWSEPDLLPAEFHFNHARQVL